MTGLATTLSAALEQWLLGYLLNSLWQIPLVFLAALIAARLARPAGPQMEHRVWAGALVLQSVLPLCHLQLSQLGQEARWWLLWLRHGPAVEGETRVILGAGTAARMSLPWHAAEVLAVVAAAYVCGVVYLAGRLVWGMWTTERLRRRATPLEPAEEAASKAVQFQMLLGMGATKVDFASANEISGPATVGLVRQTLLLPPGFLERLSPDDLDALLAHEFAHMVRWDFAKNLLYGLLALPAAYHPLLWLTRARVAETRELVCDAMAAGAVGGRESYARSLLRLARMLTEGRTPRILHAIGILDANIFERRVMHLTRKSMEITRARRFGLVAACALVAVVTCTSALALRMDVKAPADKSTAPAKVHVKSDALTLLTKVTPVYPVDAKKARIQGTVALAAVIGKDGVVENLRVVSGPSELQGSALDAVRQWKYQPFLLNGDTVAVDTTIKVVYTLKK